MNSLRNTYLATRNLFVRLHRDQRGMETIQIIMVLAVAAMVLTGVNQVVGVTADGVNQGAGGNSLISMVTSGLGSLFGGGGWGGLGDLAGGLGGLFGI